MKIYSVFDKEFQNYGQVLTGYDTSALVRTLQAESRMPQNVEYVPENAALMALPIVGELKDRAFGGMDIQVGHCCGHNTKLNCLEYHRDSELNIGAQDFILLLAKREEMIDGRLHTDRVAAFRAPAGAVVEVYATALHYAPCSAARGEGFQVAIVLPKGTNTAKPDFVPKNTEDTCLTARNKWLLAHAESEEAKQGAPVRLDGENLDISPILPY